ncbi:uncharacterized protein LOC135094754 isoform X4 [Scylla paramamosain]|uniref:uncharacterized protein LOC135094754 isoform X4 n=1 Tax=Scylla paramamosain TaxID=85552 RepID=UPI003083B5A3
MPKTCMTMCCREGSPKSDTTIDETPEDNLWLQLGFTVDSETGVYCLLLNCSETGETVWKSSEPEPTSDNKESPGKEEEDSEDSLDTLNDTLDDMIQASQLHPQHPRSLQQQQQQQQQQTAKCCTTHQEDEDCSHIREAGCEFSLPATH